MYLVLSRKMNLTSVEAKSTSQSPDPLSGLHCIANLLTGSNDKLLRYQAFQTFINKQIQRHGLNKIGEVYHNFPNGGFTAVVCLSESHLSIHTWPERNYLTFDVFLSNYLKDNNEITRALYKATVDFFEATPLQESILNR